MSVNDPASVSVHEPAGRRGGQADGGYVAVGRIAKSHGVRGEVVVEVRTDEPGQRFAAGSMLRARRPGAQPRPLVVETARQHGDRLIVRFDGVADRSAADGLRGAVLTVDLAELPPTQDPDEFYDHQLVGLAVELPGGERVGTVADVLHGAGSDLLVVERDGADDALIPFVQQLVPVVDVAAGRIVVDPPEGLLG